MSIYTVPERYVAKCDWCDAEGPAPGNRKPFHWSTLGLSKEAVDGRGVAVGDASKSWLLCPNCTETVTKAIHRAMEGGK